MDLGLLGLARYVDSGEAVSHDEAERWAASAAGGRRALDRFRGFWGPRLEALATEVARGKRKRRKS